MKGILNKKTKSRTNLIFVLPLLGLISNIRELENFAPYRVDASKSVEY